MTKQPPQQTKPTASPPKAAGVKSPAGVPDVRKALFNERKIGLIEQVQLPTEMITRLWGILLDVDPSLFRSTIASREIKNDPRRFYEEVVRPWLRRHPVLQDAEVLNSGRGLHVIIWLAEAVEFTTDAERQRWSGIVQAIQAILPSDPDAPGITALTRARDSINSKNNAVVTRLSVGKPVAVQAVLDLFEQLRSSPFRTVMQVLFGAERVCPCPLCGEEGTTLSALDHVGQCYGSCGKVQLAQLYDVFLTPRPAPKKGQ